MKVQEYTLSRALFYLMASLILAACGSGGDDTAQLKPVSTYQLTTSLASSTLTPTGTTTVTVTLKDGNGSPASGQTVQLSTTGGAALGVSSVTTDATGKGTATLLGNDLVIGTTGGVTATHTDNNGASVSKTANYSILDSENVFVSLSKNSVNSGVGDSVVLTGTVINSSGQLLTNKQLSYSVKEGATAGVLISDALKPTVATFTPGDQDFSNRQVTIVATVVGSTASAEVTISIIGTTVQLSSATTSAQIGDTITLQGTLKDGNGGAIGGTSVVLTSSNMDLDTTTSGTQSTRTVTTASNGSLPAVSAKITSTSSSAASVTATALGATNTLSINVSGTSFNFTSPAANTEIDVNTNQTVTLTYSEGGVAQAGKKVFFNTTLGTVTPTFSNTDSSGKVSFTVNSPSAGLAVIGANLADDSSVKSSLQVAFVSKTPASISVQAGQTGLVPGKQTPITATVLDADSNPVKGVTVEFNALLDPSGGSLSSPSALTDASGKASVSFTAGNNTTATDAVQIQAKVQGTSITTNAPPATPSHALLTVGGTALFVNLTSGNTLTEADSVHYNDPRGVIVTDALGNPVVGKTVTLSIIPVKYFKGEYVQVGSDWIASYSVAGGCDNEDANTNGSVDAGEDFNSNGRLDPGSPATLSSAQVTTNSQGLASFSVIYGQNYGNWVRVKLKATAGVSGTESVSELEYTLAITADDADVTKGGPPGGIPSPFGTAALCSSKD